MGDRSSRPRTSPADGRRLGRRIAALRQQRLTGKHIAMETGVSHATVSRALKRAVDHQDTTRIPEIYG